VTELVLLIWRMWAVDSSTIAIRLFRWRFNFIHSDNDVCIPQDCIVKSTFKKYRSSMRRQSHVRRYPNVGMVAPLSRLFHYSQATVGGASTIGFI